MSPRLLLIDNYDSFTYNLVQAFLVLGADVDVRRNDEITVAAALDLAPSHLCISPGPGTPYDAGVSMDMIRAFAGRVPVLEISARTAEEEIMGARHRTLMVEGVQFHPESILSPDGPQLLGNFLQQSGGARA